MNEDLIKKLQKDAEKELERYAPIIEEVKNKVLPAMNIVSKMDFSPMIKAVRAFQERQDEALKMQENFKESILYSPKIKLFPMPDRDHEIRMQLAEIKGILNENQKKKPVDKNVITLTKDGDLVFGKFCYKMKSSKKRIAILRTLTHQPIDTEIIKYETNSANNAAVRKAIGKINEIAKNVLKLKQRLIESKGEGYFLNKAYKLIKK